MDARLLVIYFVALGLGLGAAGRAVAQEAAGPKATESPAVASPGAEPPSAEPAAASAEAKAAARAHFDRGLAASSAQRFGEAVIEFERAYDLWPDFRVLYNIAHVRVALGRFAEAIDAFQAYLDKGGDEIAEARRQEVRDAIAAQQAHVATLNVRGAADGAEIRIDGRLVGRAPLETAVRVNEGRHTLEAFLAGRATQLRELDVPGTSTLEVTFEDPPRLAALPAPRAAAPKLVDEPGRREPSSPRRVVGVAVAAVGLVAAAVGGVVAYEGAADANAARARLVEAAKPAPPASPDTAAYDEAKLDFDGAKTRNQLGWALVGFGAAALVGGGLLALIWSGPSAEQGIALRGSW